MELKRDLLIQSTLLKTSSDIDSLKPKTHALKASAWWDFGLNEWFFFREKHFLTLRVFWLVFKIVVQ